jgi:hypothetical protein
MVIVAVDVEGATTMMEMILKRSHCSYYHHFLVCSAAYLLYEPVEEHATAALTYLFTSLLLVATSDRSVGDHRLFCDVFML